MGILNDRELSIKKKWLSQMVEANSQCIRKDLFSPLLGL